MVSNQSFKIYLYGFLLIGTLGTALAHHFVFNPQEENRDISHEDTIGIGSSSNPTFSPLSQTKSPFEGLANLLILLILLISALSLRKLWHLEGTPTTEAHTQTPKNTNKVH